MNSIDYNPQLDEIVLSVRGNSEIWIIDHSTTIAEAAATPAACAAKAATCSIAGATPSPTGGYGQQPNALPAA